MTFFYTDQQRKILKANKIINKKGFFIDKTMIKPSFEVKLEKLIPSKKSLRKKLD